MLLDLEKLSDVMVNAVQQPIDAISKRVGDRIDELETLIKAQGIYIKQLEEKNQWLSGLAEGFDKRFEALESRQVGNGKDGKDGKDGDQGPQGQKGEDGQPGEKGDPGPKGDPGDKGEQGEPGKNGMDGTNGKDGQPGKDGRDGKDADPVEIANILMAAMPEFVDKAVENILPAIVKKSVATAVEAIPVIHGRDGRDAPPGGPPGPAGPPGPPGKDGKSIVYRDVWNREETYVEGEWVTWDGSVWAAKQETAGEVPGKTNAWKLAVKKGTPGRDGKGEKGDPGKDGRPGRDLVHPGSIV